MTRNLFILYSTNAYAKYAMRIPTYTPQHAPLYHFIVYTLYISRICSYLTAFALACFTN